MQIRKYDKYCFDVFRGTGFDNWSRIRKFHWGYKVINGDFLRREELQEVVNELERFPNGQVEHYNAA